MSPLLALLLGLVFSTVSWSQTFGTAEFLDPNGAGPGVDVDPHVISDGAGTWLVAWWSTESLVGTVGTDYDIHLARSTDGGVTWSYPAPLNNNAASDSGVDATPYLATDNAGTWLAVWRSTDSLGNTIGTDRDILFARSTDAGATWTTPAALNSNAASDSGDDFEPMVATDGAGNWVAVWWSYDSLGNTIGADRDILVSRSTDAGATWTAPTPLNTNAATDLGEDYSRDLVTDRAGNWLVTWDSDDSLGGTIGTDSDVLFARSVDAGVTWTDPAALNSNASTDTTASDALPRVATDGNGNWLATWRSNDTLSGTVGTDHDIFVSRSVDAGATWTAAAPLNSSAATDTERENDHRPRPVSDGAGQWITVWYSSGTLGGAIGTDSDILFARSTDAGATWTAAAPLNTNAATDAGSDTIGAIATDRIGNWVTVWYSTDSLGGTIGIEADILMAQSTDAGVTWTAPAPLNANAADSASNPSEDADPGVVTDGAGSWVAVWTSDDPLGGTVGTDQDIVVSRSVDAGTSWTGPMPLNGNAISDVGSDADPEVATDGVGNWVAVWVSDDDLGSTIGTDGDIFAARSTDAGATWTSPAALNSNAGSDSGADSVPAVAADAAGNWVAAWTSVDDLGSTIGSDADILVARSGDSGATWTNVAPLGTNGASDTGDDDHPELVTDGVGTWLAVWESTDSLTGTIGSDLDTLVARSTDAGVTWTPPAPLNTNAATDAGDDTSPNVATDGLGAWVAVWASNDSLGGTIGNDSDILVTRSTDAGQTWSAPEALSVDAAFDGDEELAPQIRTDGAGNWDTVWYRVVIDPYYGSFHEILLSRSTDAGATWSAPQYLTSEGLEPSPQIATDRLGNWLVVWDSYGWVGDGDGDILQILGWGPDADGDGLADGAEANLYGTEPLDADTDGDGLTDGEEVNTYSTNPLNQDTDGDGLTDSDEVNVYTTDPIASDSDADGLTDGAEVNLHGTDPLDSDSDNDGLKDGQEVNVYLTDPLNSDTDGDGFSDGEEVAAGSDPRTRFSTPPVAYEGSLILHTFANDQTTGTGFPFDQKHFIARPLGARCNPANGGVTCGTGTLQEGAPLNGSGTVDLNRGLSPPGFGLPLSALKTTATGSLPQYSPYNYISTFASNAHNKNGFFGPGFGPGKHTVTSPGSGGPGARVAISPGANQFGGTMRLLGAMGAKRAHAYKNKTFVGTGLSSFEVLGSECTLTCYVTGAQSNFQYPRYETVMGTATTAYITTLGFPWTTGVVSITATAGPFPTFFRRTGYDHRTAKGLGTIQLVAPQLVRWEFPDRSGPWDRHTGAIGILRIKFVPEPSGRGMLVAGVGLLIVFRRLRSL